MMRFLFTTVFLFTSTLSISSAFAEFELNTLYRAQIFRTADGQSERFLDAHFYMERGNFFAGWSVRAPFITKRQRGDHWEIFSLHPMISYGDYFARDKLSLRRDAHGRFEPNLNELAEIIEFQEDTFVAGPALSVVEDQFEDNDRLIITMYNLEAGARERFLAAVARKNLVLSELSLPPQIPLASDAGSDVDIMLLQFFASTTDSKEAAQPNEEKRKDSIAQKHGFASFANIERELDSLSLAHRTTDTIILSTDKR